MLSIYGTLFGYSIQESADHLRSRETLESALARPHGYDLSASQQERAAWMLSLSEGMTVEELAKRIRASLMPATG